MSKTSAPAPVLTTAQKVWRVLVVIGLLAVGITMVMVVPGKGGAGEIGSEIGMPVIVGGTLVAFATLLIAHFLPAAYRGERRSERATAWAGTFWGVVFGVGIVVAFRLFIIAVDEVSRYSDQEIGVWFACTALNVLLISTHAIRATLARAQE
ncbi:hypothetical protein [Microbacterium hibisci]|uniref:hypothetical protein n=1 Tax=Microbacterium hibisci TaxID=2036000 RepID=UPI0019452E04|nr:hypothetical protein [Microbacterium hibisci]